MPLLLQWNPCNQRLQKNLLIFAFDLFYQQRKLPAHGKVSSLGVIHSMRTNLISRAGYELLQQELDHLWRVERRETTEKVAWAASLGDRSENADYKYNKQKLRQIDKRIRFLQKRLEQLKIVDYSPQQEGKVFFGATVSVENSAGNELTFTIAGPDEIYQRDDVISIDAPMARAALGKQLDDEFTVHTPAGAKTWYIVAIDYRLTRTSDS